MHCSGEQISMSNNSGFDARSMRLVDIGINLTHAAFDGDRAQVIERRSLPEPIA
jgi:hypothetical protein